MHKEVNVIEERLTECVLQLAKWCEQNELIVNPRKGKTECIVFGTRGDWTADCKVSWVKRAGLHVRPYSHFDCRKVNISVQIENGDVLTTRKFDKILF